MLSDLRPRAFLLYPNNVNFCLYYFLRSMSN